MIISRRDFGYGATGAAAMLASGLPALAQDGPAEVTRRLPKGFSGKTLNIITGTDPTANTLARIAQQEFAPATGITLSFTHATPAERYRKILLDLTSGTASLDVYQSAYQWKHEIAPYVADLTNLEKEVEGAPPLDLADYPQRPLDVYGRHEGKLVGLPLYADVAFFVWNKEAMAKAGLDPEARPASWEDVFTRGQKLVSGDQRGFNLPAGKSIQTACVWITLFHAFGGSYFAANGHPQFTSEASLRALRFMSEQLMSISPPGNITWDFPEMIDAFSSGRAAQGFIWPSAMATLQDPARSKAAGKIGWSPTPGAVLLGGWALSVNAKSPNINAAKLYVAWLTSREMMLRTVPITGQAVRLSTYAEPAITNKFRHLPALLEGLQGPVCTYAPIREAEQINVMIYDEANAVCAKTKTVQQAAESLQSKAMAFLTRRGYIRT